MEWVNRMSLPIEKWKKNIAFEHEARRVVIRHAESLAKNKALQEEILIVEHYPPLKLICILFPWLPHCWRLHWVFPWLCWKSWRHKIPDIYYPPEEWWKYEGFVTKDPVVMIDTIVQYLPDKELAEITEIDVLNAAVKVMDTKFDIIGKSMERVSAGLKGILEKTKA